MVDWLERVLTSGRAPYQPRDYAVYRNVHDYGAKGDGLKDDTYAINLAISDGPRVAIKLTAPLQHPLSFISHVRDVC